MDEIVLTPRLGGVFVEVSIQEGDGTYASTNLDPAECRDLAQRLTSAAADIEAAQANRKGRRS
jgi:hypothetical protein